MALPMDKPTDLSRSELEAYDSRPTLSGGRLRYRCPEHRGDNQQSLSLDPDTGRWTCHACHAWGTLDYQPRERQDWERQGIWQRPARLPGIPKPAPDRPELVEMMARWQAALPGSAGAAYLEALGIPEAVALEAGLGFATDWPWRSAPGGRVVYPMTDAAGRLVTLYGRAIGDVAKGDRHDYSPGSRGGSMFNGEALNGARIWLAEGPKDAVALIAAGAPAAEVMALGTNKGFPWELAANLRDLVMALDLDEGGERGTAELEAYGPAYGVRCRRLTWATGKDPAEALAAGALLIEAGKSANLADFKPSVADAKSINLMDFLVLNDDDIPEWTDEPVAKGSHLMATPGADGRLPYLRREQVLALDDEALALRLAAAAARVGELDLAGIPSQEYRSLRAELRLVYRERPEFYWRPDVFCPSMAGG